ncbi:MAG: substrate-binding periplasmic protein, partial [Solirubrobacterales bacterium]
MLPPRLGWHGPPPTSRRCAMESQPTQPPTVEPGALTLCCSSLDVPPLFETAADGTRSGYEPAAAEAVAAGAGLELRWLFRPWADFAPALMRGECDAIWCGCAITPGRRERMAFTVPYAAFNESVVVRPDDPASSPADLRGRRGAGPPGRADERDDRRGPRGRRRGGRVCRRARGEPRPAGGGDRADMGPG